MGQAQFLQVWLVVPLPFHGDDGRQVFSPITEIVGSGYFQQEGFGKSVYVSQIKVLRK